MLLVLQRWIGAPDFPSERAGIGLTSLKRKRCSQMLIIQCPSLARTRSRAEGDGRSAANQCCDMKADLATIGPEATLRAPRCVGPTRASVDSTAPNPYIRARESTNPRFPIPSRALRQRADKKQPSVMSVISGVSDLPQKCSRPLVS